MTPDPTNPVLAVARVTRFLDALSARRGIDHEDIHAFDVGTDREAFLKASDLRLILAHLSQGWKPDREAVARIIDPSAWRFCDMALAPFIENRGARNDEGWIYDCTWGKGLRTVEAVKQWLFVTPSDNRADTERFMLRLSLAKADAILALPTPAPKDEPGEEFLEFKEALSDVRSLRQEHRDLTGGGPGWSTRWDAAWKAVDELFANEDEAAWCRQQEDAHG